MGMGVHMCGLSLVKYFVFGINFPSELSGIFEERILKGV